MAFYLYVIAMDEDGPVKIGVSGNPETRLSTLQTGNPKKLALAHCFEFETMRDARKAERKTHLFWSGIEMEGEWFDLDVNCAITGTRVALE